jgi:RHS repeat-associated protein
MEDYPDQVSTVTGPASDGACPAATSSNIVSGTRTYYDDEQATITPAGASLGTLGTLASPGGLATGVAKASSWPSGGTEQWQPQSATEYDSYGRVTYQANANGDATTTSYSPATGQLPTSQTVTNPVGWKTVTTLDQARQLPLSVTDPNGAVTTETYDALGRLTSVTLPRDQGYKATYTYAYSVTGTTPPAVTTQTLLESGGYASDIQIYDGMLQLVQEQTSTENGAAGALISDYTYNSDGWQTSATSTPYYESSTGPSTTWYEPQADEIPSQTVDSYDGQGRVTSSALWADGVYQWQTTDAYPGMDTTTVTPPAGGTTTTTVTNSAGQTSQSSAVADSSGDTDTTSYSYNAAGELAELTDNNGNAWTYAYNLLGQKISATDPGMTGPTTYTYDGDGNLLSTTGPDGTVLTYTYDALGRKTAEYNATPGLAGEPVELASWTYDQTPLTGGTDADALGQPSSSTTYDANGQAYTETITGYNISYQPTDASLSVPPDAGALASGTASTQYTTATAYTPRTGLAEYTEYSADGGLPAETVQNTYNNDGLLTEFGDATDYLDNVSYSPAGQILSTTFGPSPDQLVQDYTYDQATNRTLQSITNLQNLSEPADVTDYTYNQAGDVTSTADTQNTGATETQCYAYNTSSDQLNELTAAWTDTGGTTATSNEGNLPPGGLGSCNNTSPSAANIGGPATYWETYTYDLLGDRTSETSYDTSLPASQDTLANATTQQITYPGGSLSNSPSSNAPTTAQAQPDTATSIVTQSPGGTTTATPAYNANGEETSVTSSSTGASPPASPDQFTGITYNAQGQVASVTTAAGTSTYLYDASGNLLLQTDPGGTSVLYADGGAEQVTASGSTLSGVRILPAPDGTDVVRSSAGSIYYTTANQLSTALETISASSLTVTRRYYDPWGNPVGIPPASWPDDLGYVGKPADPATGLDILGARQYNPATGSFTSLDPELEAGSPQQMGGYAYAANNPVTDEDPTGQLTFSNGCGTQNNACNSGASNREGSAGSNGEDNGSGGGDHLSTNCPSCLDRLLHTAVSSNGELSSKVYQDLHQFLDYDGPRDFTLGAALTWLEDTAGLPAEEEANVWITFCNGLAGESPKKCNYDPFLGTKLTNGEMSGKTLRGMAIAVGAVAFGVGCNAVFDPDTAGTASFACNAVVSEGFSMLSFWNSGQYTERDALLYAISGELQIGWNEYMAEWSEYMAATATTTAPEMTAIKSATITSLGNGLINAMQGAALGNTSLGNTLFNAGAGSATGIPLPADKLVEWLQSFQE